MRVKGRWADWAAIALGLMVGLSWVAHGMYGFSGGLFFILGLGVILAATMSLTRPGALTTEIGVIAGGAVLVVGAAVSLAVSRGRAGRLTAEAEELLGRYSSEGPTSTLYVPGPLVRDVNQLVLLELHGAAGPGAHRGRRAPSGAGGTAGLTLLRAA